MLRNKYIFSFLGNVRREAQLQKKGNSRLGRPVWKKAYNSAGGYGAINIECQDKCMTHTAVVA